MLTLSAIDEDDEDGEEAPLPEEFEYETSGDEED
jgi:26S proteasome regulatory subunit N2